MKEKGKSVILRKRIRYRTVIRTACDNTAENRFPGKKTPRETPARRKTKMNTKESAVAAQEKLSPYGAKLVYYGEIPLVGIENADPGKTAVLTFYEKEIVFEFSFHTAHFLPEDLPLALDTAEKFLMGEMSAVEFFLNGHFRILFRLCGRKRRNGGKGAQAPSPRRYFRKDPRDLAFSRQRL